MNYIRVAWRRLAASVRYQRLIRRQQVWAYSSGDEVKVIAYSLRHVIEIANRAGVPCVITCLAPGTIVLDAPLPALTVPCNIFGNGTIIDDQRGGFGGLVMASGLVDSFVFIGKRGAGKTGFTFRGPHN